jgi:hypothetical protein
MIMSEELRCFATSAATPCAHLRRQFVFLVSRRNFVCWRREQFASHQRGAARQRRASIANGTPVVVVVATGAP